MVSQQERQLINANYDYLNGFEKYKMKDRKIKLVEFIINFQFIKKVIGKF